MLSFDDDFTAVPAPRNVPAAPSVIRTPMPASGGLLAREPVHDLDAEQHALQNGFRRVRVEDKRVINGQADVNQLVPFKYSGRGKNISPAARTTGCRRKSTCSATSSCGRIPPGSPMTSA